LALASVLIKALRCRYDVLELHIPVFLLQGCVVVLGCVANGRGRSRSGWGGWGG